MKLKTIIIDDEPIALEKIRKYVEKMPALELVGAFDNAIDASSFIIENDVDLVLTDISMPDLDGMDFVKSLRNPPLVVFTTAFDSYAVESYRVSAVDYLLKPFSFADFQMAANKAMERHASIHSQDAASSDIIFIKVDYRYIRVVISDIRYIKGCGEYLQIYIIGKQNTLMTLSSFQAMMERLPKKFIQVHRSYIVNIEHIEHVERNRVVMDPDTYIPVGDSFKNNLLEHLSSKV